MMHKVFVYGSLKQGFGNHGILEDCTFLGATCTKNARYRMVSMGAFPAVCKGGQKKISGELYNVDQLHLMLLDAIEGNGEFYKRSLVELDNGEIAWMYVLLPGYMTEKDRTRIKTENSVQTWTLPLDGGPDFRKRKKK